MSAHSFADFLEQLQADGQLVRVGDASGADLHPAQRLGNGSPVPPGLLLCPIADRDFPLAVHLFSSPERVCRAFRSGSLEEPAARLAQLFEGKDGRSWLDRLGGDPAGPLKRSQPRTVRTGPSQQITRLGSDIDLMKLPAPTFLPEGERGLINAGRLITRAPGEERLHVGRYDFRVTGKAELAACWAPYQEPARILAEYRRRGEAMPLALALGGDPIDLLTAAAPLSPDFDVPALAGYLRGGACELLASRRVGLPVPADAEMILEGSIDPSEALVDAGWALDAMGQPRRLRPAPAVRIEALTHRVTAVFPGIVPGAETCSLQQALLRVFLPLLRRQLPELVDLELPAFGGSRMWAFASVNKTYPGQARQLAQGIWSLGQMMHVRFLVVVDHQVDLRDSEQVWRAVSAHTSPAGGIRFAEAPPDEFLRETSPGRMLFDATAPVDEETEKPAAHPSCFP